MSEPTGSLNRSYSSLQIENCELKESNESLLAQLAEMREAANNLLNDCINFDDGNLTPVFQEELSTILKANPSQSLNTLKARIKAETVEGILEIIKDQRQGIDDEEGVFIPVMQEIKAYSAEDE